MSNRENSLSHNKIRSDAGEKSRIAMQILMDE
jgi:hypothetical protein